MSPLTFCLYELLVFALASGESFLGARNHTESFRAAVNAARSCSLEATTTEAHIVEQILEPMWRTARKNKHGLVEWPVVRYMARRYFMQQWSLLLRGFEPTHQVNSSHLGMAAILREKAPAAVQALFESGRSSNGFALNDIVTLVAALEHLVLAADSEQVESIYARYGKSAHSLLNRAEFVDVMQSYMVGWLVGEDQVTLDEIWSTDSMWKREQIIPKYRDIEAFVNGLVTTVQHDAQHRPKMGDGRLAWSGMYSFADALHTASTITRQFSSFWESECQIIKASLVGMDTSATGRVPLNAFYGANADGEWRFGESKAYLKELGVLDESSPRMGAQVIIPNYVQAASNCIAQAHYFVCCINECDAIFNDVEGTLGAPSAEPEDIFSIISNMTNFEDDSPQIGAASRLDLHRIAEKHGGHVPLHGRLFSQWLHFVFPRECPFPQKTGEHSALSPVQFGDHFIASEVEITTHAAMRNESEPTVEDISTLRQMSLWSADEDEDLIEDSSLLLHVPWESNIGISGRVIAMFALFLVLTGAAVGNKRKVPIPGAGVPSTGSMFV